MSFRTRLKDPTVRLRIGAAALLAASLANWFLPRSGVGPTLTDPVLGLLYGLAVGFLLLSLRSWRRTCANPPE